MGIANIINTSTSSGGGGGEIIRELVNSSDGQGLYFSNTGYIHLANNAAVEFGTSDFSIEFVMNQTGEVGSSGGSIYQSATTVNNKFSIENHVSSNVVKLIFFNAVGSATQYDLAYNMAADYNEPTHYVVSCDRSGNAVLYRNGTEVASVSIATSASINLGDGVSSTAMIGNSGSGYTFLGGLYRFRTWNKALTHDEVDTCFQRADVPFESQYGEQDLVDATASTFTSGTYSWTAYGGNAIANVSNNLTITYNNNVSGAFNYLRNTSDLKKDLVVGKKYRVRITAKYTGGSAGPRFAVNTQNGLVYGTPLTTSFVDDIIEFTAHHAQDCFINLESSLGTGNVVTIDTWQVDEVGALTDHDLAFANPTQSSMCQDRAGNSDGTMGGTIQQTQPIVQLNSTSARIGTSQGTPQDRELLLDKFLTFSDNGGTITSDNAEGELTIAGGNATNNGGNISLRGGSHGTPNTIRMRVATTTAMEISAAGNTGLGISPDANAKLDVNGTIYVRNTSVKGVISNPSSDIFDIANASGGTSNPITFSTQGSERLRIGSTGTVTLNKAQETTTGTPFSGAALKLLPSGTTNTTGVTSVALGTSSADNYGFLISAQRAGSGPTPTLRITSHDNNATGTERMSISSAGLVTCSNGLSVSGDTANGDFLTTISNSGTQSEDNGLFVTTATSTTHTNVFKAESSGNANIFIVKGNGNVGIGLSSGAITDPLTVGGTSKFGGLATFAGDLEIGAVSATGATVGWKSLATTSSSGPNTQTSADNTGTRGHYLFYNPNGEVGSIKTNGSATSFNTSSDYRLKENLEPLTGALDRIEQLPVYRFNFKADSEKTVDGFVAHEAQAIVPEAVTGEKDAMKTVVVQEAVEAVEYQEAVEAVEYQPATYYEEGDELPEGVSIGDIKTEEIQAVQGQPEIQAVEAQEELTEEQPDYQGIDQSKLVPLLVAAIKELKAKIEALENA